MSRYSQDNYRDLCLDLFEAETEDSVKVVLQEYELWDSDDWQAFGDNENNWAVIGNQQGDPIPALVEKLVNSIDAVLMRECLIRDIDPEGDSAPPTIEKALETFFNIRDGNLANVPPNTRTKLAQENIGIIATGMKKAPNYTIFDTGEGQSPLQMPHTLLSLAKSNKLKIPFVQGKFNMGGTGVLPYCGTNNLQLIISRRHPDIADPNDETAQNWGFTLVRREDPSEGRKSSMFTFLAPDGEIASFWSEEILITVPNGSVQDKIPSLEWGTIIKLFDYELPAALKTQIKFDLYYRISLFLTKPGLPICFYEGRSYTMASPYVVMNGLHVRLEEDKGNLEAGFPNSDAIKVEGGVMPVKIYAFRKDKIAHYRKSEGIIFTINGQMHGAISQRFFALKDVNMGYIADSILVMVDASNISGRAREILFMPSRDRIRHGELYSQIEAELKMLIRNHEGLRELREQRRREAIDNRISDEKPLREVLDKILKKSPSLSALFITGEDIGNPTKSRKVGVQEEFKGNQYPTFFRIIEKDIHKPCELGRRFRVQFETDVMNDYFDRDVSPGVFNLFQDGHEVQAFALHLWNGTATLTVTLPKGCQIGDTLDYYVRVEDETSVEPFENEFSRYVVEKSLTSGSISGNRRPPAGSDDGNHQVPDYLSLPEVTEVREDEWEERGFNKYSALRVVASGHGGYDFFVNMDNVYLRAELKPPSKKAEPKLFEARFKYALVLIGLALLKDADNVHNDSDETSEEETVEEKIFSMTRSLAPIILPMIDSLGDLTEEDIAFEYEHED